MTRCSRRPPPKFPSNQTIATAILASKFGKAKIAGTAIRVKRTYGFDDSHGEDLQSRAVLHLYRTDWQKVLRQGGIRPRHSDQNPQRLVLALSDYVVIMMRNAVIDEARRVLSNGLSGLTARAPALMPFICDPDSEQAAPDAERRIIAKQSIELAERLLDAPSFRCVFLAYGFDGGPSRSLPQLARDLKLTRPQAEQLLAAALRRLQDHVSS